MNIPDWNKNLTSSLKDDYRSLHAKNSKVLRMKRVQPWNNEWKRKQTQSEGPLVFLEMTFAEMLL